MRPSFTDQKFLDLFISILVHKGAMCDACGFGTRATSKRWAKCKQCGKRCERKPVPELGKEPSNG